MSMSRLFQEFEPSAGNDHALIDAEGIEDQKLQSFEDGYKAGWDDAVKAQSESVKHIAADFGRNLQDASFSYHEARSAMTNAMQEIFASMVHTLLPDMAQASLGGHVLEQLQNMTRSKLDSPIEITISPNNADALGALLNDNIAEPFKLTLDPNLGEAQVYLRLDSEEREINLDQVIADISESIEAYFHQSQKEPHDG